MSVHLTFVVFDVILLRARGEIVDLDFFDVILLRARGEIVDLDVLDIVFGSPVLVGVVEASDGALLDWAFRTAVGVLSVRLALVLWWRIGAEVPAARASHAAALGRSRREAAWPGTAEPRRRTAGTRATETTRPRPGRPVFPGPCFADGQRPAFERLLVEPTDRFFGDLAVRVVHKREASRSTGLPIGGQHNLGWGSDARQMLA